MKKILNLAKGKGKASASGSDSVTQEPTVNPNVFFDLENEDTFIDDTFINPEPETHLENEAPLDVDEDAPAPKKTRKRTSPVWEHFTIVENMEDMVKCNHCSKKYVYKQGQSGGTGSLTRHMTNVHPHLWGGAGKSSQTDSTSPTQTQLNVGGSLRRYNKNVDRVEIAKMIALGAMPFSFPSSDYFITYIQKVYNPMFTGIPRTTCRADIFKLFEEYVIYLRYLFAHLKSKISLTADIGKAANHLDYLTVTAHWIDDEFNMQSRILALKYDEDQSHNARYIVETICNVIVFFSINDKIMSITFDNASNNNASIPFLVERLKPPLEAIFHIRCACHVLNLVVNDGLAEFSPVIEKIRKAVGIIQANHKKSRIKVFKDECAKAGLAKKLMPTECFTRWNTTHYFLKTCYEYRVPITVCNNQFSKTPERMLFDGDWVEADQIIKFLNIFTQATKIFSGKHYSTAACALPVVAEAAYLLKRWSTNRDYQLAVEQMMEKFRKYFYPIPMVLLLGSVLNPCFKFVQTTEMIKLLYKYMGVGDNDIVKETINSLKANIDELYSYYSTIVGSGASPVAQSSTNPTGEGDKYNFDSYDFWQEMSSRQSFGGINEYDLYCSQTMIKPTQAFNPVLWWKENAHSFPILSAMAKDVLAIPISSVASESAFSQGRQQLGDHRHSLANTSLEVLVCLRDWIRAERRNQGRGGIDPSEDMEVIGIEEILKSGPNTDPNSPPDQDAANLNMDDIINRMRHL